MKRKTIAYAIGVVLAFGLLAGCGNNSSQSTENEKKSDTNTEEETAGNKAATDFEIWLTTELHCDFYDEMQALWNEENPDKQIKLTYSVLPYEDMHNKLLIALQAGTGAPDMADIELGKFANFLKGEPQLVSLNDAIAQYKDNVVQSRLDIYTKDDNCYGLDFHVGASMTYYNAEILEEAGVDYTQIKTWDDFHEAGRTVLEKTGKPMCTVDTGNDPFFLMPFLAQQGGGLLKEDGTNNVNSPEMIKTLTFLQEMLDDGTAVVSPGGSHQCEEYWGFMNEGGAASAMMPMWYMGRFTDYMPDLSGKIIIAPNPVWEEGQDRSVGLGGTGTVKIRSSQQNFLPLQNFLRKEL